MKNIEKINVKQNFGKLIAGTSFEEYSVENKFINDNNNFVEKKTGSAKFSFAFIYNSETFGIWNDYQNGKVFVSTDYYKNTPFTFATTLTDHTPNTMFLNSARKYNCWKNFIENYELGNVRFENIKIKNIVQDLIKNLILR